jgi:hypothetical protein
MILTQEVESAAKAALYNGLSIQNSKAGILFAHTSVRIATYLSAGLMTLSLHKGNTNKDVRKTLMYLAQIVS